MFNTLTFAFQGFGALLYEAWDAFRKTTWPKRITALALGITIGWVLKLFYGTFIIDHMLMTVLGYFLTYKIFKPFGTQWKYGIAALRYGNVPYYRKRKAFFDRFWLMTFPLSLLSLWVGGALPYLNLVPPESVYFYVFPASWLVVNGNDFMWNVFVLALAGKRIIPLEFLPTTQYLLFNIYAVLYWLSFIPCLGWAVAKGRQTAFLKVHPYHPKLWGERLHIVVVALFWLAFDIGMASLLYWIYA